IFYSLAGYYAELDAVQYIVGGHNGIGPESFPDSSPKFFNFLNSVFHLSLWSYDKSPVKIVVPLSGKSKEDVIRMGLAMDVPFDVTWSCYWDKAVHCGICVSCRERREAFAKVGIEDPVEYEAPLGQCSGRTDPVAPRRRVAGPGKREASVPSAREETAPLPHGDAPLRPTRQALWRGSSWSEFDEARDHGIHRLRAPPPGPCAVAPPPRSHVPGRPGHRGGPPRRHAP